MKKILWFVALVVALLVTPSLANAAPEGNVGTIQGNAECLYGGPGWMVTWTIESDYPFSTIPASIESGDAITYQWNAQSATLTVLVNVGTATSPVYETLTSTANKPEECADTWEDVTTTVPETEDTVVPETTVEETEDTVVTDTTVEETDDTVVTDTTVEETEDTVVTDTTSVETEDSLVDSSTPVDTQGPVGELAKTGNSSNNVLTVALILFVIGGFVLTVVRMPSNAKE